ncbi:hypothetical protein FACS1894123_01570 [Bacteroidia bacterium]|nr:hypothetical protein FACS1894123_01570 [Bacteroidia bacterium]
MTADEIYALGGVGYEGFPYKVNTVSGIVQAEDYDSGGEGVAFHAVNPVEGNTYRPTEITNIAAGPNGDYHLVTANGDWYNYTISVPESRTGYDYVFKFYGQKTDANTFNVLINGVSDGNTTDVEFPASYDEPIELSAPVTLKPGNNLITIQSKGGNFDKIEILKGPFEYKGRPFFDEPYVVSANSELVIEAQYFDRGAREVVFHDNTTNGGNDVSKLVRGTEDGSANVEMEYRNGSNPDGSENVTIGWSNAGEWLAYTLDVKDAGDYDVFLLLSTDNTSRVNHIEIDEDVYPEIMVKTSDWGVFEDFVTLNVKLTAGKHILYVYYQGNFDKIKIKKNTTAIQRPNALPGKVYAENGILKVKEFPASASLAVYNLLGQKIANYKSVNGGVELYLPTKGIYIVKIQEKSITSNYKVIVK